MYGKDWKKIEALVGTRNGAQIRSHAQKFFSKMNKNADTKSQDSTFFIDFFYDKIFHKMISIDLSGV